MVQRRFVTFALTLVLFCAMQAAAQPGPGDPPRRGPGPRISKMLLLQIPAVQKELDLSDEQLAAIDELAEAANDPRGEPDGRPPGVRARLQTARPDSRPRRRAGPPTGDDGPIEQADGPPADGPPADGPPADGRSEDGPPPENAPPSDGPPRRENRRFNRPDDQPGRQPPRRDDDRGFGPGRPPARMDNQRLAKILDEAQLQRLNQIMLQMIGSRALRGPKIAEQLGIDEDQAKRIAETLQAAAEEMRRKMRQLLDAPDGDFEDMREKVTELRKEMEATVLGQLTEEQLAKFGKMQGAEFELPPETLFRLGGGGRPGFGGGPPRRDARPPDGPERLELEE